MIPQKRYYGTGRIDHFSPPKLAANTKVINCYVDFVQLLQIKAAVDEAVIRMNRNNRGTREGRDAKVNLAIHLEGKKLTVHPPLHDAAYRAFTLEKQRKADEARNASH